MYTITPYVIIPAIMLVLIFLTYIIFICEKKSWNQGYCLKCGDEWKRCDNLTHVGRRYRCKNKHEIFITWDNIDQ